MTLEWLFREEQEDENVRLAERVATFYKTTEPALYESFEHGHLSRFGEEPPLLVRIFKAEDECETGAEFLPTDPRNEPITGNFSQLLFESLLGEPVINGGLLAIHESSRLYPYAVKLNATILAALQDDGPLKRAQATVDKAREAVSLAINHMYAAREAVPGYTEYLQSRAIPPEFEDVLEFLSYVDSLARESVTESDASFQKLFDATEAWAATLFETLEGQGFPLTVVVRQSETGVFTSNRRKDLRTGAVMAVLPRLSTSIRIGTDTGNQRLTLATRAEASPLINAPEFQVMADLTSNYTNRELIKLALGERRAIFRRGKGRFAAILDCADQVGGAWDEPLAAQGTEEERKQATERRLEAAIWAEVDHFQGVSRDDALVVMYAAARLVETEEGVVRLGFTELLDLEGKTKLGAAEREKRAREYDRIFRLWNKWKPVGQRKWKDPHTGKIRVIDEPSPLLIYQGPFYLHGQGPLTGMYDGPDGFTFVDSTTTKDYRADPTLCHAVGVLQHLAQIPGGKVAGDWARSIGLTAVQFIRNNAKNTGGTMQIKRKTLLTRHPPNTPPDEILGGKNPKRALKYWDDAIGILKERGVIASVEEPAKDKARQAWGEEWLNQTVSVTLGGAFAIAPERVLKRTEERKKSAERKRGVPKKQE